MVLAFSILPRTSPVDEEAFEFEAMFCDLAFVVVPVDEELVIVELAAEPERVSFLV